MKVHTVQKGDSLWKISKTHGIPLEALIAANPQIANPDQIDVGQQVNIPDGSDAAPAAPNPGFELHAGAAAAAGLDVSLNAPTPASPMTEQMTPQPMTPPPAEPEPAYPSVPKWEGLWKYVVKHGDTMFKIAKQVGVTLDHLKAANPQVPNPDKIYPGQVLNIPSSGMKMKSGNPGSSLKEQLTSPMATQSLPKEQLLKPKEMAPMEKGQMTMPMYPPVQPPMPMPMPMPAAPLPIPDINLNLQYAPHKHHAINYSPQKEIANNFNTNIGYFPHTENVLGAQQAQQSAPVTNSGTMPAPVVSPMAMAPIEQHMQHHPMMLYYIPVSLKKKKHKHKCHKKVKAKKCSCHKHMHHDHHHVMMQHMGLYPKTFYREED